MTQSQPDRADSSESVLREAVTLDLVPEGCLPTSTENDVTNSQNNQGNDEYNQVRGEHKTTAIPAL